MVKKAKRYSTSFKVVLILLGAIAIGYLAKFFTGTKQVIFTDTVAENHSPKKHKRKHKLKRQLPIAAALPVVDTIARSEKVLAVKPAVVKHLPDSTDKRDSFLYTTYVRPNVTGIVRLRRQDNFYADVIADIPANANVRVLKKGHTYYQVVYNNNTGFVPRWALQIK
ncbi:hypothetical protein [Mucilaginibacter panaciglaebae]|uniref:SH3 domain-containing protein n=1 Tax=Mucilaginibacter panaciglaebae TaxID=502331 RepID=A0ABP7WK65_9SPHI